MTPASSAPLALFASFSGSGGVERMLVNLMHGLVALGQPVELLLVRAEGPHLAQLSGEIPRIGLGVRHTQLAIPALARYLRRRRPAALLAAKDRAGRAAVLARALAGTDTRLVLRLGTHLSTAMAERGRLERALRFASIRWLYPHIDQIIAVSEGVAADTRALARLAPERVRVIRNPVITPELYRLAAAPCPHPWLEPGAPAVILGVGRLQRQKDFPTLLRAFAKVRAARPECRLIILGEGGARAQLERLAAELGLSHALALPGFQPNPYAWLARARLFVLSSAWEGSPNVLTEALALGIPSVATDCPSGPAEILAAGHYGPLVPVGDPGALAAAMLATLANPLPASQLRAAVADYAQDRAARAYLDALGRPIPH